MHYVKNKSLIWLLLGCTLSMVSMQQQPYNPPLPQIPYQQYQYDRPLPQIPYQQPYYQPMQEYNRPLPAIPYQPYYQQTYQPYQPTQQYQQMETYQPIQQYQQMQPYYEPVQSNYQQMEPTQPMLQPVYQPSEYQAPVHISAQLPQLNDILMGALGEKYAEMVQEICAVDYTGIEKQGFVNLCKHLERSYEFITTESELKTTIERVFSKFLQWKKQGKIQ